MVSTRRGVRVSCSARTNSDRSPDAPATPSTGRRTRSTARQEESPTHHALVETSSQLEKSESGPPVSPPTSPLKRCARASRLHSPEQPCTPVGSTHEADTSDLESCCSVRSDTEPPVTRTRGKRRPARAVSQEDEEISEVESCSSAVSASKPSQVSRRSTRRKAAPESSDPAPVAAREVKVDPALGSESCSSVASESKRVTRSQRKTAGTRSAAKRVTEESEVSDADSCTSSVSAAKASRSTARRATKSTRSARHIPFDLDEASDGSRSPAPKGRQTRAATGKAVATVDAKETLSPDSEGFESGPTYSRTTRRTGTKALDSDSEPTDRGTPCSSRTGSGNSSRAARVTRRVVKELCVVLEKANVLTEEDSSLNDSRLESTLITGDADCTLVEEDMDQSLEEKEADPTLNEADAKIEEKEVVFEPAVTVKDQQEELSAESKDGDASEVEMMQEVIKSSQRVKPCQSVTVTICEVASVVTEEKDQATDGADVDAHSSQGGQAVGEDAAEELRLRVEEDMDVTTANTDAQQVVDSSEVQAESIQVTSSQQHTITVESDSEQQPKDVTVQNVKVISLLESSEGEDAEEEKEASGVTEEKDQATGGADVDAHSPQGGQDEGEDAAEERRPSVEEDMDVSTLSTDTQQVVDSSEVQAESIWVTSSQQHTITVESDSEQQPKDVAVQNVKVISLLESSDDEDEDAEEEKEASGEEEADEDSGCMEEAESGGPSEKSEAATASVEGLFMIDTRPGQEVDEHYYKERSAEEKEEAQQRAAEEEEFVDEEGDDDDDDDEDADILFSTRNPQLKDLSTRIDPGLRVKELGGLYINLGDGKSKPVSSSLKKLREKKSEEEVMKKSVIGPDFEKMDAVPPYSESKQAVKLKHRVEKAKSTGDGWFNMKAPELTQELKGDLQVLKMRGSMDPKRFYKKNDRDGFPKYFQVGTVVDSPVDFYHSRVPKKARKRTMVGELLADAEFRHKNKKKYQQIVTERAAQGAGKRNKKKSKFHKK